MRPKDVPEIGLSTGKSGIQPDRSGIVTKSCELAGFVGSRYEGSFGGCQESIRVVRCESPSGNLVEEAVDVVDIVVPLENGCLHLINGDWSDHSVEDAHWSILAFAGSEAAIWRCSGKAEGQGEGDGLGDAGHGCDRMSDA